MDRHLVATRLDAAGLSAREVADYLGHELISMTQDVSMSRKTTDANAAAALDAFRKARGNRGRGLAGLRDHGATTGLVPRQGTTRMGTLVTRVFG